MPEFKQLLKQIEMFMGLSDEELIKVGQVCQEVSIPSGQTIIERNEPADCFYLIEEGTVEILTAGEQDPSVVVTLGNGQIFGEMALVDSGKRSASVRAATDAVVLKVDCNAFIDLCETDTQLGYRIMRNVASDLSFKLRHRNLIQI